MSSLIFSPITLETDVQPKTRKRLDFFTQLGLTILGGGAIILVALDNKWGFVAGLASQPFWFITSALNRQWGVFFLSIIYASSWIFGIYKNFFM